MLPGIRRLSGKNGALLLMMTPGLALLLVFNYAPMVGLVIAFKDYRAYQGLWGSAWVGLQNFQYLFGTSDAWHITYNTLLMNGLFIMTTLVGSIGIALFGLFYQVPQNSGLLYSTTDVIDTYVFRSLTVTGNVGMAAAAAPLPVCVWDELERVRHAAVEASP
jgi:ABC-type polysaccharide transport system permease subunit